MVLDKNRIELYNPYVIKILLLMNEKNVNLMSISRNHNIPWLTCRRVLGVLYEYQIVNVKKDGNELIFSITESGKLFKEHLLRANNIIINVKRRLDWNDSKNTI